MKTDVTVESIITETDRVAQVRGIFDLTEEKTSGLIWHVHLPIEEKPWQIGLITGPSGCGKSTIARKLWSAAVQASRSQSWSKDRTILDDFPNSLPIKDLTHLLSSIGFSSPPAWLRPFHVLSTGQQFRVMLARMLADAFVASSQANSITTDLAAPIVCDEFTSVVDRTVAKVGSAALAKIIRSRPGLQFIAISCHEDVIDWLNPDWVYRPAEANAFAWRTPFRRPRIDLSILRCQASAWQLFAPHHYLNTSLLPSAWSWLASWEGRPVAFSAWLPRVGPGRPARREHRTVCLPDFQGVGIGNALSCTIASMWTALGFAAYSTTTHPAMIRSRQKSPLWFMHRKPGYSGHTEGSLAHATGRLTAGFRYTGPPMNKMMARMLFNQDR